MGHSPQVSSVNSSLQDTIGPYYNWSLLLLLLHVFPVRPTGSSSSCSSRNSLGGQNAVSFIAAAEFLFACFLLVVATASTFLQRIMSPVRLDLSSPKTRIFSPRRDLSRIRVISSAITDNRMLLCRNYRSIIAQLK